MTTPQPQTSQTANRERPASRRVEFYAQFRGATSARRADVLEFLDRLETDERIDTYETDTWPARVCLKTGDHRESVVERFNRFNRWADSAGVSIQPPFEVSTTTSIVDRDPEPVLRTPAMCIAVYEENELRGVFPCSAGEECYTVNEGLRMLAAAEPLPFEGIEAEEAAEESVV